MAKLQASAAFARALDDNAQPKNGALWKVYSQGTTTQATTYSNAAMSVANAWPVISDAAGRFPDIYVAPGNYRIRVETAGGSLIAESDNNLVYGVDPGDVAAAKFATLAIMAADTTVGYALGGGVSVVVAPGDEIEAQGYRFIVAASGAADADRSTASGLKTYAQPLAGQFHSEQFDGADIGAQVNAAIAASKRERQGGSFSWMQDAIGVRVTPGTYAQTTMIEMSDCEAMTIDFTGTQITNFAGAITSLKIVASSRVRVIRPSFNLRNNNNPDQAIWIAGGASWLELDTPGVLANTTNGNFAAIRLQQGTTAGLTPDVRDNGNFWVTIRRPWTRKLSGGDSNNIPIGVDVQGAMNALRINDGSLNQIGIGVLIREQSAASGFANDVRIFETAFEGFTTAVSFQTDYATNSVPGGSIRDCRFEGGTSVLNISGFGPIPTAPVQLDGNYVVSNVTNYVVSGATSWYNSFDNFWTPGIADARFSTPGGLSLGSAGSGPSLFVEPRQNGGGGSIQLLRGDGVTIDGRIGQRVSGGLEIDGGTVGFVKISASRINFAGIPTSNTGVSGDVWNDAGTLKIVP